MRQILARHHHWVEGATITESYDTNDDTIRRFTATIRGWRNFLIYEGKVQRHTVEAVKNRVQTVRDSIDMGNESIFYRSVALNGKG